ncbi:MAG: hypothetical protein M4579_001452 [Chaenotheca gracillima]|nr:MAG: hypothetical protein M4579_001452 [Chaenotheca gracillima]
MTSQVSHENLPYIKPSSIGHELAILFGFLGANVVGHLLFWLWWTSRNRKEASIERRRLDELLAASRRSGRVMESPDMGTIRQQQWRSGDSLSGPGWSGGPAAPTGQYGMATTGPGLGLGPKANQKRPREWWEEMDLA